MSMILIQRQVLSSSAASVTFSNIPQTYKSLKLVMSARSDNGGFNGVDILLSINGSTANMTQRTLFGNGASSGSNTTPVRAIFGTSSGGNAANTFGNAEATFPNYSSTTANKAISSDSVSEDNATTAYQNLKALLWSSTSAITSLSLSPDFSGNFVANSSFSLYGLSA